MNEHNTLHRSIAKLIDGELSAEETTSVLQQCETEPNAWRTLALGMLEAREVRFALNGMLAEQPKPDNATNTRQRGRGLTWFLAAACLACLGFLAGRFAPNPAEPSQPAPVALTNSNEPGQDRNATNAQPLSERPQNGLTVVGFARIHNVAGQQAPIPVITGPDLDYHALLREPVPVPDDLVRKCRNEGLAIQASRRVMALEFADGQRFAVPIDQFGFRYVGNTVL